MAVRVHRDRLRALSGFHALIATGTTPKMINRESDIRPIGYGAMLLEGFVSLTALIAACSLEPGDYFKINTEKTVYKQFMVQAQEKYHWDLRPRNLDRLKKEAGVKEDLAGRTAGAVSLALGMAEVLRKLPGMTALMAYLYHFVIMFEALFILTLLETGTRVCRFILQELFAPFSHVPPTEHQTSWITNIVASLAVCGLWGFLLYNFEIDRLWLLNGIGNQLLATIGLAIGTTYLLAHAEAGVCPLHWRAVRGDGRHGVHGEHRKPVALVASTGRRRGVAEGRVFLPADVRFGLRVSRSRRRDRHRLRSLLASAADRRRRE